MITPENISVSVVKWLAAIAAVTALSACGGSSDAPQSADALTGTFIDAPVEGIGYRTESIASGATDSQGRFSYLAGESVTFFIGSLDFPTTPAHEVVTPFDLAGTTDVSDPTVINIARLLQTLDENGDPDDGITIPEVAADVATQLDFSQLPADFEAAAMNFIANAGSVNVSLISEEEAIGHLSDTMLALALDGSTIVGTEVDPGTNANVAVATTLRSGGTFEDVADDDFGLAYDAETNSHEATIGQGTWTLDGDLLCLDDDHPGVDCWYLTLLGNDVLSYTDAAKTQLAFSDVIAERVDEEKLLGRYRLRIEGYDDECNVQVECYFEFSADGTLTEYEFDVVDQTADWEIDADGNLRVIWYEVDGTQRGVGRFYIKDVVGTDSYEAFGMVLYVDLFDQAFFPVMIGATMTRVP